MWKWFKNSFTIQILLAVMLAGCIDKADDPYFARPDNLASPIYQRLEEMGDFSLFLKCVDKTAYGDVLKRAGYYTLFAPTDSAFDAYLKEKNVSSVDDLTAEEAAELVSYAIVFTAYNYQSIDDAHTSTDPVLNSAFRRKSNNYKGVYTETSYDQRQLKVVDINRVLDPDDGRGVIPMFVSDDNNYKWLTILTQPFFDRRGLTAFDYNYFFPTVPFSGFNVNGANVLEKDVQAENGYIHIVDKVLEPQINLEEALVGKDEYSMFKEILDKYMVNYSLAPTEFSSRYNKATGNSDPIYVKSYPWLLFAPNTETITPASSIGEDQYNSLTMFAPNNAAVQKFFDEKFLVFYNSLDDMSDELISDFVNSHLFLSTVWPSRFELAETKFTDEDIIAADMSSNGLFYGTNRVQESDDFFTVYGEINLNPKYSLMKQALQDLDLQFVIKNSNLPYTVFMVSDSAMMEYGFSYDAARSSWRYAPDPSVAFESLNRFIRMHIVRRDINDFSEEEMILTYGDEYVKYQDGYIVAAGNQDSMETAIPVQMDETPNNGTTYKFMDKPFRYSVRQPIEHLEELGNYSLFVNYLKRADLDLYDPDEMKIKDLNGGIPNTILALPNAAMLQAIKDGVLPRGSTDEDILGIKAFMRYHMVQGTSLAQHAFGIVFNGDYQTAYKDIDGNKYYVNVLSDDIGNLTLIDIAGRQVKIHPDNNNFLSNRVIIHELETYLNPFETTE